MFTLTQEDEEERLGGRQRQLVAVDLPHHLQDILGLDVLLP
jgi:hypothetical protein